VLGNTKVNDTQVCVENYDRTVDYLFKSYETTNKVLNFRGYNKPSYTNETCFVQDIYIVKVQKQIQTALLDQIRIDGVTRVLGEIDLDDDPFN